MLTHKEIRGLYKQQLTRLEALAINKQLGIDWTHIALYQYSRGLDVELEYDICDPRTKVTGDDPVIAGNLPRQT